MEKRKIVWVSLKAWQTAKKAAIDEEKPVGKWLEEAIFLRLDKEKGEKK